MVDVAVMAAIRYPLTYRVPPSLDARTGQRVQVPLGSRRATGIVLQPRARIAPGFQLRDVLRVLDPEPDRFVVDRARAATAEAFPIFRKAVVAESWGGMIDVMPDAIPVISPVESLPGFFIATGFSGHGFGIGPGAGKLVADMVAGDPTLVDPAPFRLSRFTDSSNPRPHPLAS